MIVEGNWIIVGQRMIEVDANLINDGYSLIIAISGPARQSVCGVEKLGPENWGN
jgi:hypothetical protein